jgi:hypothetical protein
MSDTPTPTPTPDPTPAPTVWHGGKIDADTLGFWQNKGYDVNDPINLSTTLTKQYREAERFIGADPKFVLKLPKDASDEAGWNSVYQRLGKPADVKDYDFSTVKFSDGTAVDDAFADTIRQTAFANHLSKDAATSLANAVVKFMEGADASEAAARAAQLNAEKAELAKSWGANAELNKLTAMQGAKRLGIDPETVAVLENTVGYAKVMEMFRKIGAGTSEDTFVDGGSNNNPVTRESAQARLNELTNDQAWGKRLLAGDAAARREFDHLSALIAA